MVEMFLPGIGNEHFLGWGSGGGSYPSIVDQYYYGGGGVLQGAVLHRRNVKVLNF